jgi:very-short-patch-repair endonuclease
VLCTRGALGFATAAHLWGIIEAAPDRISVVVSGGRHVAARPGVRTHRVVVPPSAVQRLDGYPATTRRWTLLDHLGQLSEKDAVRLADRALQRRWLTLRDVEQRLSEFPGRAGNRVLRTVLSTCGDGAAAHSERLMHRLLRRAGIDGWTANQPVWADGELIGVVDIAFRELRLAIEIDGLAFHTDVDRFQRDRIRQNGLVSEGWTVLRFTWADLTQRPGYVIATIRRHLHDRGVFAS